MPVFRVDIIYQSRKRSKIYRVIDGVDLDTFYLDTYHQIQRRKAVISKFEIVQISEHSQEAKLVLAKMKEMTLKTPNAEDK